jgi:hypothetical protein
MSIRRSSALAVAAVVAAGLTGCASSGSIAAHVSAAASSHRLTLGPSRDYGDDYANGVVPVGDGHYVTSGPKRGYIYACQQYAQSLSQGDGGAMTRGPWFTDNDTKYDVDAKVHVAGEVAWNSQHTITTDGSKRVVTTNDLPPFKTGVFPIQASDPAYAYDRNPNSITAQSISLSLAKNPTYGAPSCIGGEVGVMTDGVMLFNALDDGGRDAGAWEVQDRCDGHPMMQGVYHFHTLSPCIKNISVHHVIGWAFDGFPITGPNVSGPKHVLTTSDLDVCHGITSKVTIDGKSVTTYHYVMTADFPYSVSCFRGTPVTTGPVPAPTGGPPMQMS